MKKLHFLFISIFFVFILVAIPCKSFAAEWTNIGFPDKTVNAFFVDPKNNNDIVVNYRDAGGFGASSYSNDGGSTWQNSVMTPNAATCARFTQSPLNQNEIWAACSPGIYHSVDKGKSFSKINFQVAANYTDIMLTPQGVVFVMCETRLIRSFDGISWEYSAIPGQATGSKYFTSTNSEDIYVNRQGFYSPGLYRSSDYGNSWQLLTRQEPFPSGGVTNLFVYSRDNLCAVIAGGISCSNDGGFTWPTFKPVEGGNMVSYTTYYGYQNPDNLNNIVLRYTDWGGTSCAIYAFNMGETAFDKYGCLPHSSGPVVSQGVVYTSVNNPAGQKGLWRNDGIVPQPEYLKKRPVIIVPGFLGSWYTPWGGWDFEPIFNTYTNLYDDLKIAGYEPDKYLFKFPYQWRADNRESAALLKQKIDEAKAASGATKVDIVAHSMGGIVTRVYAESDQYENDINSIIFIGTPQLGLVKSYPMWEAGDLSYEKPSFRLPLGIILREEASATLHFGANAITDYIHDGVPSVQQLLPIYSYISGKTYPNGYPRNEFLEQLDQNKSRIKDRGIKVTNIVDSEIQTLSSFDVTYGNYGGLWPEGKPTKSYSSGGDETVLINSSTGVDGNTITKPNISHMDLPKFSINEVFSSLGIINVVNDTIKQIDKYLFVAAFSPVDFYVVAPDGKKIGFNKDGTNFNEITGAFYTGNESDTEFLTIPNPLDGEYRVVTTGTGTGNYEIEASYANDESGEAYSSSYHGETVPNKEDNLLVDFDSTKQEIEAKIDDKKAPQTEISLSGDKSGDYYKSDVAISLTASDTESGVDKVKYSLDGITWQNYGESILFSSDGENTFYYRSTDKSGNVEETKTAIFKIDKTAPEVSVSMGKTVFTHWDKPTIVCNITDNFSGIFATSLEVNGQKVGCNDSINLFDYNPGHYSMSYIVTDNAQNVSSGGVEFDVVVTYQSFLKDIDWLYKNKHFKSHGDEKELTAKIHVENFWHRCRLKNIEKKLLLKLIVELNELKKHKKIDELGYNLLYKDVKFLLEGK